MNVITILSFLIEKSEMAMYRYTTKQQVHIIFPMKQTKVILETLTLDSHGATAPNIDIKNERRYLDAAP